MYQKRDSTRIMSFILSPEVLLSILEYFQPKRIYEKGRTGKMVHQIIFVTLMTFMTNESNRKMFLTKQPFLP